MADMDDEIRIAADEWQVAPGEPRQKRPVLLGGLGPVVKELGRDDEIGLRLADERDVAPVEEVFVAVLADMKHLMQPAFGDQRFGDVAGGDEPVPGLPRHPLLIEHVGHLRRGTGRVRQQDDRAAVLAEAGQRRTGRLQRPEAVMHDAPDIADEEVVLCQQRAGLIQAGRSVHRVASDIMRASTSAR